jgi:uncharacterized protein
MKPIELNIQTARRFILGRQGLWPGRRWQGQAGTVAAMNAMEALQLDPLIIVARSQDIVLWGRVIDYQPEILSQAVYQERRFFDFGDKLFLYPMEELPYWQFFMRRASESTGWAEFAREHGDSIELVRSALRERGPLGNRDFEGAKRFVGNYRGRKDTALALYYLWIKGDVMIHHRQGFDRVYDLRERIVPAGIERQVSEDEAIAFFGRKTAAFQGLTRKVDWASSVSTHIQRKLSPIEIRQGLEESGLFTPARVEGWKDLHYLLTEDLPLLETITTGGIPPAWQSLNGTTEEEVVFLGPLDIVCARDRSPKLFDFVYRWEVYIPVEQRRWGYYNIPVLWGDRLVARIAPRLDRTTMTLQITGFWPDDVSLVEDEAFVSALARGLRRFQAFLGAKQVSLDAVEPPALRVRLQNCLEHC